MQNHKEIALTQYGEPTVGSTSCVQWEKKIANFQTHYHPFLVCVAKIQKK
jgi:hypothetical protein